MRHCAGAERAIGRAGAGLYTAARRAAALHDRAACPGGGCRAGGTITQVTVENFQNYTATIAVQQYFKGSGPSMVTITNFGTGADCRSAVHVGDDWIFFAKGDPSALMRANYLSQFDAITTPSADTIAEIIAALNSRPRAYLPLLVGGANIVAGASRSADDGTLAGAAILFVVVGAIG